MADAARFSCDGCGKTYGWKQELAGRKVKCKCSHVMVVPATPPPPEEEGLFELAPEEPQPKPTVRRQPPVQVGGGSSSSGSIMGATAIGLTAIPAAVRVVSKKPAGKPAVKVNLPVGARPPTNAPGTSQRDPHSRAAAVNGRRGVYMAIALLLLGLIACLAYFLFYANDSRGDGGAASTRSSVGG